jgi:beta-N-acetylhexosaminidase
MDIPALDNTKNLPSTLSRKIVTGVLKDSLGFKGLVVSDAMEMKGVVKYFPNGDADLRAFLAGNDIIELSQNSARAIKIIRKAVRKDQIAQDEFNARVKKILAAKYWAGLNDYRPTKITNLTEDLNRTAEKELVQQLSDNAVTLLRGNAASVQLNPILKTAIISIGVTQYTEFQKDLSRWYPNCALFRVGKTATLNDLNSLYTALKQYQQVFISINDTRPRPQSKLDYSNEVKLFIAQLAAQKNTVVSVFANPYTIAGLPGIEKAGALLACYQMSDDMQRSAVKVIIREINPTGKLPVNVNAFFPYGTGIGL